MLDSSCRHDVWTHPEPRLRQGTAIDDHLQAAADLAADVIEVSYSDKVSTSMRGRPMTVAASDRAAWTADQQAIRPFREDH